jgi:predicted dehydrogenase
VTPTVESTERAVARCAEAGVVLAVNHTRRWAPDVVRLAAELKAGASGPWGEVRAASGTYNKGVLNNGAHLVDLLHLLLGPLQVVAAGAPRADHFADDPSVPALLRGAQGVPVVLNVADARDYALFELQLATSRACITMEDGGLHWRVRHAVESADFKGYRTLDAGQVRDGEYFAAMSEAVADLHAALAGGRAPRSTGASALQAQRVCEALRLAAAGGAGPAGGAAAATIAGPRVE